MASKRGNTNMVGLLLDRGSQIDAKTRVSIMKNTTMLMLSTGDAGELLFILPRSMGVGFREGTGARPLQYLEHVRHM